VQANNSKLILSKLILLLIHVQWNVLVTEALDASWRIF
jgi:hypothetical protein